MSEVELIGTIYSYLIEEFGFGYCEKDLWMISEKLAKRIANKQPTLNDNQQSVMDWLKENYNHKYSKRREVFWALSMFTTNSMYEDFSKESVGIAYSKLDNQQFAQVLEAFAKWAHEQEGEI